MTHWRVKQTNKWTLLSSYWFTPAYCNNCWGDEGWCTFEYEHLVWPADVYLRTKKMTVFTRPYCLTHPVPRLSMGRWLLHWVGWAKSHVGSCCAIPHCCPPQALMVMTPGVPQHWSLLISPISRMLPHFQEPTSSQELHLHLSETNSAFGEHFSWAPALLSRLLKAPLFLV